MMYLASVFVLTFALSFRADKLKKNFIKCIGVTLVNFFNYIGFRWLIL